MRRRLPRARGDRPVTWISQAPSVAAPPRPRGSTCSEDDVDQAINGSPAPAGIDPSKIFLCATYWRLPRARGDRPLGQDVAELGPGAPPRPRGSTLNRLDARVMDLGSPAPAGIDLPLVPRRLLGVGLPRARGDRPRRLPRDTFSA